MDKACIPQQACSHRQYYSKKLPIVKGLVTILCITIIISFSFPSAFSDVAKTKKDRFQTPAFHTLSNSELLKQVQIIINEASGRFLAQLRRVTKGGILLELERQESKFLNFPDENPTIPSEDIFPVEIARITLDHAETRLDVLRKQLGLIQEEKTLLNKQVVHIESAQAEANTYVKAFESLQEKIKELQK